MGLQIACRDYDLEENKPISSLKMPFQESDIVEINPLVKHLDISSDDVQANMEIVRKLEKRL